MTVFSIRLDEKTRALLDALARSEERTRGDFLRRIIRAEAVKRLPAAPPTKARRATRSAAS